MAEKHSYEIIVLDLDGTLTNRDKVITPKTKQRLMELQERGKKIVLASGRPTPGVLPAQAVASPRPGVAAPACRQLCRPATTGSARARRPRPDRPW